MAAPVFLWEQPVCVQMNSVGEPQTWASQCKNAPVFLWEQPRFLVRCYARLHPRAVNCRKKKCGHSNQKDGFKTASFLVFDQVVKGGVRLENRWHMCHKTGSSVGAMVLVQELDRGSAGLRV
ncbi:Ubiquitin-60S ribosomal protein L40-1 [Platanthera guangdongensis]|uniref:Ubiquitin-60S ribosomal protein L40-1 n=1 Tax=Platanthera guangdongensis TaxID=2320717 RepID=A0ABR2N5P0_9ASPA